MTYTPQIRSNLVSLQQLFTEIKEYLQVEHIELMKQTPLWPIMNKFVEDAFVVSEIRKSDLALFDVIRYYDRTSKKFKFGANEFSFEVDEIAKIWGLTNEGTAIPTTNSDKAKRLVDLFDGEPRITMKAVKTKLLTLVQTGKRSEDVVLLLSLFILITLFFANSTHSISFSMANLCLNFVEMSSYNWAESVHKYLMKSLDANKGQSVNGCAISLLYWFAETSNFVKALKPASEEEPIFSRWSLGDICLKINSVNLDDVKFNQVEQTNLYNDEDIVQTHHYNEEDSNQTPHLDDEDSNQSFNDAGWDPTLASIKQASRKRKRVDNETSNFIVSEQGVIPAESDVPFEDEREEIIQKLESELISGNKKIQSLMNEVKEKVDELNKLKVSLTTMEEKFKIEKEMQQAAITKLKEGAKANSEMNDELEAKTQELEAKVDEVTELRDKVKKAEQEARLNEGIKSKIEVELHQAISSCSKLEEDAKLNKERTSKMEVELQKGIRLCSNLEENLKLESDATKQKDEEIMALKRIIAETEVYFFCEKQMTITYADMTDIRNASFTLLYIPIRIKVTLL